MPRDKTATHERVIEAARAEFQEYGFENASMRRIAQAAGITAAGLYRHFPSKEAMFDSLVEPAVRDLADWIRAHTQRSARAVQKSPGSGKSSDVGNSSDGKSSGSGNYSDSGNPDFWEDTNIDMMRDLVYPRMEEYRLLLTRSQGTRYEHFLHDFVVQEQEMMLRFFPLLRENGHAVREVSPKELHLLLSAYTTALFEPVIHGYGYEEAISCLETVEMFFMPGWKQLLGF